jgi:hypothetical protein
MSKTETVAEFLARGGQITKIPAKEEQVKPDQVKSTKTGGPAVIMKMDEADLYYGEVKKKKAKKKKKETIDISALPKELREKYIDAVMNEQKENFEDQEDDLI